MFKGLWLKSDLVEEGTLLRNHSIAVIYYLNKSNSSFFLQAAGASLLSLNIHTASFQSTCSDSEADNLQCTSSCIEVEFQRITLQNVIEMLRLFSSPLFHSLLVLPFSDALFCLLLSCTDDEVNWARIAVCYCFRGHCMSACKLQSNTVGLRLPKRGEKRVNEVQRAV